MANTYTDAQKRATLKYQADKVKIQILITPEQREMFKEKAKANGMSVAKLILEAVEKY